jgi:hypothetical protein
MKKKALLLMVIFLYFLLPVTSNASTASSLTQFGITWTFDKEYEYGQFANGDYWVVGPVRIIHISPASTVSGTRTINGSMINPSPQDGNHQGYDSAMSANEYVAELNAARPNQQNLSVSNPLNMPVNSSLVSSISIAEKGYRPQLKTAAILTVLGEPPAAGSFRPPYCGTDKSIRYNASQLDFSLLQSLSAVSSTPEMSEVERYFERPWIDHIPNWSAGYQHPEDNMPNYGREIAAEVGIGALMLNLDFSDEAKRTLLIRYVQLGIDLYGVIRDGGIKNWEPNGGHASGRKWPVLFAGMVLNDVDMIAIGRKSGAYLYSGAYGPGNPPPDYINFGEDGQTFYVTQEDVDRVHVPNWEGITGEPYLQSDIGMPEWGIRHSTEPEIDNRDWTASYRQCCTAHAWPGFILAAHVMNAKFLWNHDALFDYQDRYMDTEAPHQWMRCWDGFTEDMWDAYRYTAVCANKAVHIGQTSDYYDSVSAAYTGASTGQTILIQGKRFFESLLLRENIAVTLRGGYNCNYSSRPDYTTLSGSLTSGGKGSVTIDRLIIK